jgi:hypothetical protein
MSSLTEAQKERLVKLIEECSEIQKVACKILLWGYDSVNPYAPQDGTNLNQLQLEMGDYDAIFALMANNGDIDVEAVNERHHKKYQILPQFLHEGHEF